MTWKGWDPNISKVFHLALLCMPDSTCTARAGLHHDFQETSTRWMSRISFARSLTFRTFLAAIKHLYTFATCRHSPKLTHDYSLCVVFVLKLIFALACSRYSSSSILQLGRWMRKCSWNIAVSFSCFSKVSFPDEPPCTSAMTQEMFGEVRDAIHPGLGDWRKTSATRNRWPGSHAFTLPEGLKHTKIVCCSCMVINYSVEKSRTYAKSRNRLNLRSSHQLGFHAGQAIICTITVMRKVKRKRNN